MRKFISLFNVQLKSIVNFSALKADKKERRKIAGFVAILLCLTPSYIFYFFDARCNLQRFCSLNQQGRAACIGAIGTSMIVLIFGLMYVFCFVRRKSLEMFLFFSIRSR
jgi:hypothetical protein